MCGRCGDPQIAAPTAHAATGNSDNHMNISSTPIGATNHIRIKSLPRRNHIKIPLGWLETASSLPGRSLHAGIAIWHAAGLTRSRSVALSNVAGLRFGLDRNAKYRALNWLEGAGLIKVERKLGRAPLITILDREVPP